MSAANGNDNNNDDSDDGGDNNEPDSVWEDDMVQKFRHPDTNKEQWQCLWCNSIYITWNSTKVVAHLAKKKYQNIAICTSRTIDEIHRNRYTKWQFEINDRRDNRKRASNTLNEVIDSHNSSFASELDQRKKKSCGSRPQSDAVSVSSLPISVVGQNITSYFPVASSTTTSITTPASHVTKTTASSRGSIGGHQLTIQASFSNPSEESKLTVAIADLIHSHGLPFTIADDPKFRKILFHAKSVDLLNYVLPNQNQVAGELLDLNHAQYMDRNTDELLQECDAFGLTLFGDVTMVKKFPY